MALVVRPLIAQINAQYSQIPSEMSAYCTLTIHQQRKYTSMYSFNGNEANWEDYVVFDLVDPKTDLWVELWIQQFGSDRKIGQGHIDLKKHYHRSSYRQSEKMELKNMDKVSGVLRLTIEYKSSKQDIDKIKRRLSVDKTAAPAPIIVTEIPSPVLKHPVYIQKTPSTVFYQPNSIEQSVCGNVDTAGHGILGYNNVGMSQMNQLQDESRVGSNVDFVYHPKVQETSLLKNEITQIGEMTPLQYMEYCNMNQYNAQGVQGNQIQPNNGFQQNYQNPQVYNQQQGYQQVQQVQPTQPQNQFAQQQSPLLQSNQYPQQFNQQNPQQFAQQQLTPQKQDQQFAQQQSPQAAQLQQPQQQLTQLQIQQQQLLQQQQQLLQLQQNQVPQFQQPNIINPQMQFNQTQQQNFQQQAPRPGQFPPQQQFYNNNVIRR